MKSLTSSESEIVLVPYDEAYEEGFEDMPRRVPDLSRIQSLIGYQPSKDLEQIVQSVIDYQESLVRT